MCDCVQLDMLDRSQLSSRLTLNCTDSYVEPQKLKDVYVTIMDVSALKIRGLQKLQEFLSWLSDENLCMCNFWWGI